MVETPYGRMDARTDGQTIPHHSFTIHMPRPDFAADNTYMSSIFQYIFVFVKWSSADAEPVNLYRFSNEFFHTSYINDKI